MHTEFWWENVHLADHGPGTRAVMGISMNGGESMGFLTRHLMIRCKDTYLRARSQISVAFTRNETSL